MSFGLFDPDQPFAISHRRLPHWFQPGVTYFITFRTIDSMPGQVLREWYVERESWLHRHGIAEMNDRHDALRSLPASKQREYHKRFSNSYHEALDKGHGDCLLRRPDLARIVADSFLKFDRVRYLVATFVVMPNHIHWLGCLLGGTSAEAQCKSWKRYTAREIHRVLNRRGHFWQAESFDHLVRSPEQFDYLRAYIADNPRRAALAEGEFVLYQQTAESVASP